MAWKAFWSQKISLIHLWLNFKTQNKSLYSSTNQLFIFGTLIFKMFVQAFYKWWKNFCKFLQTSCEILSIIFHAQQWIFLHSIQD